jgi:hypothetical protein
VSYFDHVKCHHCGAQLDPDKLSAGMTCTRCGGELSLQDLFGVKDAFVGHNDGGGNDLDLDDLLAPGRLNPYAEDPLKQGQPQQARPGGGHPERSHNERPVARPPSRGASQAPNRAALPMGRSTADRSGGQGMVHVPRQSDDWDDGPDEDVGGTPSALELMRKMKKRR